MGGGKKFWEDYWEVLEEIPDGWVEDKTAGAPGSGMVFITNGKSILNGRKRALLKIKNLKQENHAQVKGWPQSRTANKPLEWTGRHQPSAAPTIPACHSGAALV